MTIWCLQVPGILWFWTFYSISHRYENWEFGQIADLTQNLAPGKSPLQKESRPFDQTDFCHAVSVGLFLYDCSNTIVHQPCLKPLLLLAFGMIVAFIPEGLLPYSYSISSLWLYSAWLKNMLLVKNCLLLRHFEQPLLFAQIKQGP